MFESGVWDGTEPKVEFAVPKRSAPPGKTEWEIWGQADRDGICSWAEQVRLSTAFNPYNLRMPVGKDGAPWPWRETHMPSDHKPGHVHCSLLSPNSSAVTADLLLRVSMDKQPV